MGGGEGVGGEEEGRTLRWRPSGRRDRTRRCSAGLRVLVALAGLPVGARRWMPAAPAVAVVVRSAAVLREALLASWEPELRREIDEALCVRWFDERCW